MQTAGCGEVNPYSHGLDTTESKVVAHSELRIPQPIRVTMLFVFTDIPGGAAITVRVTPRAGRTALAGFREGVLAIKIAAPPVEGAANAALIDFLAETFDVAPGSVQVARGSRGRVKRVRVGGASAATLNIRLQRALESS